MSHAARRPHSAVRIRRSRQTHLERSLEQTYQQTEALVNLLTQISPRAALPPMRAWAISPDFAVILHNHLQRQQPQTILELGSGISTLITAYTLEKQGQGHLYSVDHAAEFLHMTHANLQQHELAKYVTCLHAPLKTVTLQGHDWEWYDTTVLPNIAIDLLVVDGPPQQNNPQREARYPALPLLLDRLNSGGYVLLDDAARTDERRIVTRWLAETTLELVARLPTEKGTVLLRKP